MYEMIMTSALDANACLTPRGVTDGLTRWLSEPHIQNYLEQNRHVPPCVTDKFSFPLSIVGQID
jgi:hypothetical protein